MRPRGIEFGEPSRRDVFIIFPLVIYYDRKKRRVKIICILLLALIVDVAVRPRLTNIFQSPCYDGRNDL